MKRDMDLVREILLQLENSNEEPLGPAEIAIEGRTNTEVSYHIELLHEAGLLEGRNWSCHSGHDWRAIRLTWWGMSSSMPHGAIRSGAKPSRV